MQISPTMKDGFKNVRWRLDRQRGVAMPEKPSEHLTTFTVPIRPMLGCVAVAPGFGSAPPATGDSGRFGGNMDFNEIVEGASYICRWPSQARCSTSATGTRRRATASRAAPRQNRPLLRFCES